MEIALWFDRGGLDPLAPPLWHVRGASYTALTDMWRWLVRLRETLEELESTGQPFPQGRREERTVMFGAAGGLQIQPDDVVLLYLREDLTPPVEGEEIHVPPVSRDYLAGTCPSVVQVATAEMVVNVVRRNGVGMMIARNQAEEEMERARARQMVEQAGGGLIGRGGRRLN